jgi:spermidine/putrescine transport system permease protein
MEKARRPALEIRFGEPVNRRRELVWAALTSGPGIAWVSFFLLAPLLAVAGLSFLTRGTTGGFGPPVTFDNFLRLLGFGTLGFEPLYPLIIARSLLLAAATTAVCAVVAFPLAFFIAGLSERRRALALTLIVIPFWTNLLIRTYAWQILLAPASPLTRLASRLGLIAAGTALYPGTLAVYIGMLCAYLPFLVLPLYTAVEKLDWSIVEAAMDLGADGRRVFRPGAGGGSHPRVRAGDRAVRHP